MTTFRAGGLPLTMQLDVKIPMRDGVLLSADIYLPPDGGPFPALLQRTPYDNQSARDLQEFVPRFVRSGYAVVMQDCRGRHDSDGQWRPYLDETNDGYDTQRWIAAQPWCDGNIGTFGSSYPGFTQTMPAPLRSPHVKALVPRATQQDNYGIAYVDGAFQMVPFTTWFIMMAGRTMQSESLALIDEFEVYWRLPLVSALDDICDAPVYRDFIRHHTLDEYWRGYGVRDRYHEIDAPAFFMTGWYDSLVHESFKMLQGWRGGARTAVARETSRLLVGPWTHGSIGSAQPQGELDFGPEAGTDIVAEHLRWYDRHLKSIDNGFDETPPIRLFVMGHNVWRDEEEWPLARTVFTRYYLHSGGRANSLQGDVTLSRSAPGKEPPDRYNYDPDDPVPTLGGPVMRADLAGPRDRRFVERRDDMLVYTSEVLSQDLEVMGPVAVTLYAASTAPDTDFTATLVDVHRNETAVIICEGIRRARFRESLDRPTLIEPGRVYEYVIDLWDTSNVFKAGHRIRVEVSSSNFPRFDRNLNTGHQPGLDSEMRVAEQTIHHDSVNRSHITLPIIPQE